MGVIYLANAFFLDPAFPNDPRGHRISVPAPVDPQTPDVDWWYDRVAKDCAMLREVGFTAILLPPVCKTQSGNLPTGTGYGLFDHYDLGSKLQQGSVETRFGTREQLQRLIAVAHANGLNVYDDMVLHQMAGGKASAYRYKGAPSVQHPNGAPDIGRFPKDAGCFRGPPPSQPQDPVPAPADDFAFGDELVYVNCNPPRYTIDGVKTWADWLIRSMDFDGFRVDDTKGLAVAFIRELLNTGLIAKKWCFGEFFDGNPSTLAWYVWSQMNGRMSTLDFGMHFGLKAVCDYGAPMTSLNGLGYAARDPWHSVNFVDDPDTDLSPGQSIVANKLLAYAFMLTVEGQPMVYYKDYAGDPGCYGLKPWIDTLVWIHEHLAHGRTATRWADHDVIALERLGHPGLLTAISKDPWNARTITCDTIFGPNQHLHDYTGRHGDIWTDSAGRATFTIPSNYYGSAHSYLCWSRAGVADGPRPAPRSTTQVFVGAVDLDIAPAYNGPYPIGSVNSSGGRVWCASGTPLSFRLMLAKPAVAAMKLTISDAAGTLQELEVGVDGVSFPASGFSSHRGAVVIAVPRDGWISFAIESAGLPPDAGIPFELEVTYTGTRRLA